MKFTASQAKNLVWKHQQKKEIFDIEKRIREAARAGKLYIKADSISQATEDMLKANGFGVKQIKTHSAQPVGEGFEIRW